MSPLAGEIGAITGLGAEARLARRFVDLAIASGSAPGAAESAAIALADRGVAALISFGLAGALVPGLAAGDLILPDEVVLAEGSTIAADSDWLARIARRLPGVRRGSVAGVAAPIGTAAERAALARRTGAIICDMESHQVARIAQVRRLPFVALRAVADTIDMDLPPAARIPLRSAGRPDFPAIALSLFAHPGQIVGLVRVARASGKALRALLGGGDALGRGLAFGDPG